MIIFPRLKMNVWKWKKLEKKVLFYNPNAIVNAVKINMYNEKL
jgi:hypothetical protein